MTGGPRLPALCPAHLTQQRPTFARPAPLPASSSGRHLPGNAPRPHPPRDPGGAGGCAHTTPRSGRLPGWPPALPPAPRPPSLLLDRLPQPAVSETVWPQQPAHLPLLCPGLLLPSPELPLSPLTSWRATKASFARVPWTPATALQGPAEHPLLSCPPKHAVISLHATQRTSKVRVCVSLPLPATLPAAALAWSALSPPPNPTTTQGPGSPTPSAPPWLTLSWALPPTCPAEVLAQGMCRTVRWVGARNLGPLGPWCCSQLPSPLSPRLVSRPLPSGPFPAPCTPDPGVRGAQA